MKNNEQPIDNDLLDDVFSKYQKVLICLISGRKDQPLKLQTQKANRPQNEYWLGLWWRHSSRHESNEYLEPNQQVRDEWHK